jgi:hypothetical protein
MIQITGSYGGGAAASGSSSQERLSPRSQIANRLRPSVGYSDDILAEWNRKSWSGYNAKGRFRDVGSFSYKAGWDATPDRSAFDAWLAAAPISADEESTIRSGYPYKFSYDKPESRVSKPSINLLATLQLEFGNDIWLSTSGGKAVINTDVLRAYKPNEPLTINALSVKFERTTLPGNLAASSTDGVAGLAFLASRWDGVFDMKMERHTVLRNRYQHHGDEWLALGVVHYALEEEQGYLPWVKDILRIGVPFDTLIPYFQVGVSSVRTLAQGVQYDIDPNVLAFMS